MCASINEKIPDSKILCFRVRFLFFFIAEQPRPVPPLVGAIFNVYRFLGFLYFSPLAHRVPFVPVRFARFLNSSQGLFFFSFFSFTLHAREEREKCPNTSGRLEYVISARRTRNDEPVRIFAPNGRSIIINRTVNHNLFLYVFKI